MEKKEVTIDARGKSMGRVAQEAATILRGKNLPEFQPNKIPAVKVTITNASKIKVSQKKADQKTYTRYTGYPGGLRQESMTHLVGRKGYSEIFRKAVRGMLPANRLRSEMLKNLTVTE